MELDVTAPAFFSNFIGEQKLIHFMDLVSRLSTNNCNINILLPNYYI